MPQALTRLTTGLCLTLLPVAAGADLLIRFDEGAPKDRLSLVNASGCETGPAVALIDLTDSAGGLYFDTTAAGAGVDVFQPVELIAGDVEQMSVTGDGDTRLELRIPALRPGKMIVVTMDLDDRLADGALGQTRIAGTEISGATVTLTVDGTTATGRFGSDNNAEVPLPSCVS